MMRAIRFARVTIEVEEVEMLIDDNAIVYDEYLYDRYGIKVVAGTMKHWYIDNIVADMYRGMDDMYWKWAERSMDEKEFSDFCQREEEYIIAERERINALKKEAIEKGYLTIEECAKI